uniref:PGG domain-containing protein n=1 Tax=Ficus carica TaxID=3494 RepID=A0AA88E2V8_FICCA|nr:hypothetical protein TIFTF001_035177 [Ficus carica]
MQEVETVVYSSALTSENSEGMTPWDFFAMNHKDLVIAGEKWMKDTATSCTVVGALIVTIMFAVAFQVPGGNNQETGYPIFVNKKLFKVFIVSDAISLFSSTTSVLTFLGILTSRYAEEDFLTSLPTKLIVGLSTLFFSIATMIISFCAIIFIMFRSASWILIPVILLAIIPITLFAWMQFPLLVEIFNSTYGPSIFNRKIHIKVESLEKEMLFLEEVEKHRGLFFCTRNTRIESIVKWPSRAVTLHGLGLDDGDYTTVSQNRRVNGDLHDGFTKPSCNLQDYTMVPRNRRVNLGTPWFTRRFLETVV